MHPTTADNLGKLVLRVVLSVLILLHGIAKIPEGAGGIVGLTESAGLPGFIGYGVFIGEILAPIMLLLGWHARIGAALIAINMLFAIGLMHPDEILMLNQHGGWQIELQGMYLLTALALVFTGPGKLSINQR
ncbi:DoxX family protein [Thiohalorhabdus sp.]|uniref:DoxX family protein n=1 Tax=Thiohalorhabdus sp. TaxID=3094134 RepID=UPI002FC2783A